MKKHFTFILFIVAIVIAILLARAFTYAQMTYYPPGTYKLPFGLYLMGTPSATPTCTDTPTPRPTPTPTPRATSTPRVG